MGDLKKKKIDYISKANDRDGMLIGKDEILMDEKTIERLRTYMKKFYEMQLKKQEGKNEYEE